MTAPIQFAIAADGARIAYSVSGSGRAVLYMAPLPFRHVELEWKLPEDRIWLERLGKRRRLIRYDPRGLGLSAGQAGDFSLETFVLDLEAVVEAAAAGGPFVLFACLNTAPLAIRYAVLHPGRVSHLVLWCPVARMADSIAPQIDALLDVAARDWELFTETVAHVMVGWSKGEAARRYAGYLRACVAPERMRTLIEEIRPLDVSNQLEAVRAPTLVLHRRGVASIPVALATEISSRIPGARLSILEGDVMRPGVGDCESAAREVDAFLGDESTGSIPDFATEPGLAAAQVFHREGEYWTLSFGGQMIRVRDAKGLHHIARLIREPGVEMPATELVMADEEITAPLAASPLGDAGPVLDEQAKRAYRARLVELRAELDQAEQAGDAARTERARVEHEFLAAQISAAVGLGGRDRRAASTAERARLTVTKRIKDAIARIRSSHPSLARHLAAGIRTGHFCSYQPEPGPTSNWTL